MKAVRTMILCGLMAAAAALAQQQSAMPDPMADAATPNGKVVQAFFTAVMARRHQEAFDKYVADEYPNRARDLAATPNLFVRYPNLKERTIALTVRGEWVFMTVVQTGNGDPRLVYRVEQVKNGKIVRHAVTGMTTLADVQTWAAALSRQ